MDRDEIAWIRLAQAEEALAMEERHIVETTAALEQARRLGWAEGEHNAGDLLALCRARIAHLEHVIAELAERGIKRQISN